MERTLNRPLTSRMNSKAEPSDKFFPRRKFHFPRELFIELTLSPKDVKKMRQWEKEGHTVTPLWYANCKRVLFVDWTRFEEWKKR
jgi:hypothetical protein